jgi:signal transduction histidine kinase
MLFAVFMFNVLMSIVIAFLPHMFEPPQHLPDGHLPWAGAFERPDTASSGLVTIPPTSTNWLQPNVPQIFGLGPLLVTFLFLTISVSILGVWAANALISPLKTFVGAAEQFRAGGGIVKLEEKGPTEIRTLARALNEMQTRISDLIAQRTRMLATIGHDLRTPITRLRLRAEFMPNAREQNRMLADLDHMEALVSGALRHLEDGRSDEGLVATDLNSLLQTIADQFMDLGTDVYVKTSSRLIVRIRPHEFQRAVGNLVENAVRYGRYPGICIAFGSSGALEVVIEDSGDGLDDSQKVSMVEPFTRADSARSMNEFQGFGLGLSIASQIAESHGGRLELRDNTPTGLVAAIVLPAEVVVSMEA